MPEPTPGRIVRENRRDLREPEHEHEIEEQLERRDRMPAVDALLDHGRTLTGRSPTARVELDTFCLDGWSRSPVGCGVRLLAESGRGLRICRGLPGLAR